MAGVDGRKRAQVFLALVVTMAAQAALGHTLARRIIEGRIIAESHGPIALKPEGVRVELEPAKGEASKTSLATQIGNLSNNRRLYLVIRELHAENPPDAIYQVYLNLPRDKKSGVKSHSVGSINFYASQSGPPRSDFFFSYDVTDTLKNLIARKLLTEPLTVTIIPAGEPNVGSLPTVGLIQLIEQ